MRNYEELVDRLRAGTYTAEELSIILPKAADVIEELSKLQASYRQVNWIRVEDRLPENDSHDRFLVCAIDPWFGTKVIDFMRYDRRWLYDGKPTEAKVTHWMPLPEPPEVDHD